VPAIGLSSLPASAPGDVFLLRPPLEGPAAKSVASDAARFQELLPGVGDVGEGAAHAEHQTGTMAAPSTRSGAAALSQGPVANKPRRPAESSARKRGYPAALFVIVAPEAARTQFKSIILRPNCQPGAVVSQDLQIDASSPQEPLPTGRLAQPEGTVEACTAMPAETGTRPGSNQPPVTQASTPAALVPAAPQTLPGPAPSKEPLAATAPDAPRERRQREEANASPPTADPQEGGALAPALAPPPELPTPHRPPAPKGSDSSSSLVQASRAGERPRVSQSAPPAGGREAPETAGPESVDARPSHIAPGPLAFSATIAPVNAAGDEAATRPVELAASKRQFVLPPEAQLGSKEGGQPAPSVGLADPAGKSDLEKRTALAAATAGAPADESAGHRRDPSSAGAPQTGAAAQGAPQSFAAVQADSRLTRGTTATSAPLASARIPNSTPAPQAPKTIHDITLELDSGSQRAAVRLTERGGELHVAVRTTDENLANGLRQQLPALSERLEQSGFRASSWHSGAGHRQGEDVAAAFRQERNAPGGEGSPRDPQDGRQQRDGEREAHPRKQGKDFARFLSSLA